MSCRKDRIVYDPELHAYICIETGEVLDEKPIVSMEPKREDEEKGGNNLLILNNVAVHDYGIGTDVSHLSYREARAVSIHHILGGISKRLRLPRYIQEDSAKILRTLMRKGFTAGRKTEDLIVAVIYASIRRYGLPIGLDELCRELGANKKRVWSFYKSIVEKLGLKQEFIPLHIYIMRAISRMGIEYRDYQPIIDSILSRLPVDLKYKKPDVVAQSVILIAYLIKRGREVRE